MKSMEEMKKWSNYLGTDTIGKNIDINSLPHQTNQERFMTVLNYLKTEGKLRNWMLALQPRPQLSGLTKDTKSSKCYRERANELYLNNTHNSIMDALEGYTLSLTFAPTGSEEMALAYANRSAILLKVQLYEDALLDISRALKSGYPDCLKAKLFARRAMCLKALRPDSTSEIDRALWNARKWLGRMEKRHADRTMVKNIVNNFRKIKSLPPPRKKWNPNVFLKDVFEENCQIFGASKAIEFKYLKNKGSFVEATRDIIPGEIIAIQEPFVASLGCIKTNLRCHHCFLHTWSGIPCHGCVITIYCSESCRDTAWRDYHDIECGVINNIEIDRNSSEGSYALGVMAMRAVIKSLKEAGSLQKLKDKVKRMENDSELMEKGFSGLMFDGTTLETFFSLPTYDTLKEPSVLLTCAHISVFLTFLLAMKSKFFGEVMNLQQFLQSKWIPFVGGLVTKYSLIMIGGCSQNIAASIDDKQSVICGLAALPLFVRFTHRCAPNVSVRSFGRKSVIFAHYPIKKGEEIFACLWKNFEISSKKERQEESKMMLGVACQCIACEEDWVYHHYDVVHMPPQMWSLYKSIENNSGHNFQLIYQGNFPIISKMFVDLAEAITEIWTVRKPPCSILSNLSAFMWMLFSLLGNRHEMIKFNNN